jgi:plasmid stability protein
MADVPTLHIQNVPEEVYVALRVRATERGTSIATEAIGILDEALRSKRRNRDEVMASIEENAKMIGFGSDWPAPEDLIREERDSR